MLHPTTHPTLTPYLVPSTSWGVLEVLALAGAALWVLALAWLVGSDLLHSAQRHHLHLPHRRHPRHDRQPR